ncbi:MAG TPA: NUDIX hydrolase [Thermoplasmata archaeon]|nr:NUDIX hydrolase [Thermoplasmata archaeon]
MEEVEKALFPVGAGTAAGGLELRCVVFAHLEDRLVIIRQHKDPVFGDAWTLPGGTLDYGVHPRLCATRLLKTQTGETPKTIRLIGVRSAMEGDWVLTFEFEAQMPEEASLQKGSHAVRTEPIDAALPEDLHPWSRSELEMYKVLRLVKASHGTPK